MKISIGDRVAIPPQASATIPGLVYPARPGVVTEIFSEGDTLYAELLLDDGTHIISAPLAELAVE